MTTTEPSTTPKRTLPEPIEAAIQRLIDDADLHDFNLDAIAGDELKALRSAILTALDTAADTAWHDGYQQCFANNLTATSSAHEGREE